MSASTGASNEPWEGPDRFLPDDTPMHSPERRGFDLSDEQLEELVRHFERVKPLTEDERRRAQAALREAASKFRMRS